MHSKKLTSSAAIQHPDYIWSVDGEYIIVSHKDIEVVRFWAGTVVEMLGRDFVMKRVKECDNTEWIGNKWNPSKTQTDFQMTSEG
jgi:hypothetical protein